MIVELNHNSKLDQSNEGKLVYLKGRIEVNEPLTEPEYGVTIAAVRLKRRVQMYQWVEVHEEPSSWWGVNSDESAVSYTTTWRDRLIDSSLFVKPFGHANPKSFPVDSGVSVSDIVKVGPYTLGNQLKEQFTSFTLLTSDQRPDRRDIKMHSGLYYHSFDVWNPEVGDTRVQLSYGGASDDVVTVLAQQVGSTLQPFVVDSKDMTTVLEGEHSLSQILASKFPSSGVWLIRVPAYLAIYCAFSSLTSSFYINGKRSRVMHAIVQDKCRICHTISAATVFTVMALAWFPYSPLIGSVNLIAAFLLITYCGFKGYSIYSYLNR